MKTTVCTQSHRISVEPCLDGLFLAVPVLDLAQVGALLFGLETAAEQADARQLAAA